MISNALLLASLVVGASLFSTPAQAYDMDCKLILCLAGGFPPNCADAKRHMLERLRRGKSPVGVCAYQGPSGVEQYSEATTQLGTDRWTECPGDLWRAHCERFNDCYETCAAGLRTYEQRFVEIEIPAAGADQPPLQNHIRFGPIREVEQDGGGE